MRLIIAAILADRDVYVFRSRNGAQYVRHVVKRCRMRRLSCRDEENIKEPDGTCARDGQTSADRREMSGVHRKPKAGRRQLSLPPVGRDIMTRSSAPSWVEFAAAFIVALLPVRCCGFFVGSLAQRRGVACLLRQRLSLEWYHSRQFRDSRVIVRPPDVPVGSRAGIYHGNRESRGCKPSRSEG